MNRFLVALSALSIAAMVVSEPLHAQELSGVVRDDLTGTPVRGAVVMVLAANRETVTRGLTSSTGAFKLSISTGTLFRVIRIGYAPYETAIRSLGSSPLTIKLRPLVRAIAAMTVRTNPVCPRRNDQREALALWASATDAMLAMVVALTDSSQSGSVTQLLYNRVMADDRRIERQSSRRVVTGNVAPIRADRNPEDFVENGYVIQRGDVTTYYAPDPAVLLDSSFAATHCLSIREDARVHPGEIGVAFAPPRNRDSVPDISGVLWLTRSPMALRSLTFDYRGVHRVILDMRAGGQLDFETLSNGVPIIRSWHVRSPKLRYLRSGRFVNGRLVASAPVPDIQEVHATGGMIVDGQLVDGTMLSARLATLGGVVRTARTDETVAGALVTLDSTDQQATTDGAGRFSFQELLPGPHVIRALDSVAIFGVRVDSQWNIVPDSTMVMQHVTRIATRALEVRAGMNGPVEVLLPWRESVNGCGRQEFERRFVVMGLVVQPDSTTVPLAAVRFSWADTTRGGTTIETIVDTKADDHGEFIMCGIPAERELATQVILPSGHGHFGVTRISRIPPAGTSGASTIRSVTLTIPP